MTMPENLDTTDRAPTESRSPHLDHSTQGQGPRQRLMPTSSYVCLFTELWKTSSETLRALLAKQSIAGNRCGGCPRLSDTAAAAEVCGHRAVAEQVLHRREELWIGGSGRVNRRRPSVDAIGGGGPRA